MHAHPLAALRLCPGPCSLLRYRLGFSSELALALPEWQGWKFRRKERTRCKKKRTGRKGCFKCWVEEFGYYWKKSKRSFMSLSQAMRKLLSCLKELGDLAKSYFSCCSRPCIYHRGISPRNRETLRGQAICPMSSQHPNCMKKDAVWGIPPFKTITINKTNNMTTPLRQIYIPKLIMWKFYLWCSAPSSYFIYFSRPAP